MALTFDHVLDYVGSTGRWQIFLYILTSVNGFFNAFHNLGSMFLAATPDHWCEVFEASDKSTWGTNWTSQRVKDYTIPVGLNGRYDHCHVYSRNYSDVFRGPWSSDFISNSTDLKMQPCTSWIYDRLVYESTVVSRWNLVCNRAPLAATVQSTFMLGIFFGTLLFGLLSDRFGRRFAIRIALIAFNTGGLLAAIPVHYVWFLTFRFMIGIGSGGIFAPAFVLMTESVNPKLRDIAGIAFQIPFGFGYMMLPVIGYYIRSWVILQLTISLMGCSLFLYYCLLPESPRWLLLHDRSQEAFDILRQTAKINKKSIVTSQELHSKLKSCNHLCSSEESEKISTWALLFDLFKTPQMRKRIVISYFAWWAVSLNYYGLSFLSPTMGTDVYFTAFLTAATEIPSYILGCLTIKLFSRKLNVISMFFLSGACCLVILAIPRDYQIVATSFAITGKFFINIAYAIVYLYATELFPTKNRNIALGTSSMCARFGASIAPYVVELMNGNVPLIIFGSLAVIAGCLCVLLPETKGKPLPQTVDDIEREDEFLLSTSKKNQIYT